MKLHVINFQMVLFFYRYDKTNKKQKLHIFAFMEFIYNINSMKLSSILIN